MRGGGAGGPKPTAKKRADPAKTKADMAAAAHGVSPLVTPSAPKMIPNGNAPTSNGNVSRAPARNSARRGVDCGVRCEGLLINLNSRDLIATILELRSKL